MTDIALKQIWESPSLPPKFDIAVDMADLAAEEGLQTAVILSLFLNRRAEPDDVLPSGDDRRGWWSDAWPEVQDDKIGSRLWLLSREKQLQSVVEWAREYAEEALAWLVEDGIAVAVRVQAEIVRTGVLGLSIEIERPSGDDVQFRFEQLWEAL